MWCAKLKSFFHPFQGRPITPKELPTEVNMFSENVPNTNAGNYGGRLNTDTAQTIQSLEYRFNSHNRKKKMGDDLVCYWLPVKKLFVKDNIICFCYVY